MLSDSGKRVVSNVFRDTTKAVIIILVIRQFVPGQSIELANLAQGLIASAICLGVAVYFAPSKDLKKEAA